MQVKMCDSNEELVWNSTKFFTIGTSEHSWSVNISSLGLAMSNRKCNLTLKLFNYFLDINQDRNNFYIPQNNQYYFVASDLYLYMSFPKELLVPQNSFQALNQSKHFYSAQDNELISSSF